MLKIWFKYYIYDISIGVLFGELLKNFQTPPLKFLYLIDAFDKLKSDGLINDYTLNIDSNTGKYLIKIDASSKIQSLIIQKIQQIQYMVKKI